MLYNVAQLLKAPAGSDLRQEFAGDVALPQREAVGVTRWCVHANHPRVRRQAPG